MNKAYYDRIRELREDNDMNQTIVAKYLGMAQNQYSRYETGKRDFKPEHIALLAKLFRVTSDYILGLSDKKN